MTKYGVVFVCSACGAETPAAHDGVGGSNAPKGWVQVTTEPLHVSRVCGSRSGTTAKTLCSKCATPRPRLVATPDDQVPEPNSNVSAWDAVDALRFLLSPTRKFGEVLGLCRAIELAKGDAPYREHAAKTGDPVAPVEPWSQMPSRHVSDWTLADGLRFALYWAQVWHKQAGGYLATGTANGLDRVLRMLKKNDACFDRDGLRDEILRLLGRFQLGGSPGLTADAILNRVVHAFGLPFGTAFGLVDVDAPRTEEQTRALRELQGLLVDDITNGPKRLTREEWEAWTQERMGLADAEPGKADCAGDPLGLHGKLKDGRRDRYNDRHM